MYCSVKFFEPTVITGLDSAPATFWIWLPEEAWPPPLDEPEPEDEDELLSSDPQAATPRHSAASSARMGTMRFTLTGCSFWGTGRRDGRDAAASVRESSGRAGSRRAGG